MKKSLLALAVLGAFAGAASAQSSVTLYGVLDIGYGKVKNGKWGLNNGEGYGIPASGNVAAAAKDGFNSTSVFGMRGSEDLGGGTRANFELQSGGLDLSTGATAVAFSREAWAGLSGGFGQIRFGRSSAVSAKTIGAFDLNGTSYSSALVNAGLSPVVWYGSSRRSDQLQYWTNSMGGLVVRLGLTLKNDASADPTAIPSNAKGRVTLGVNYATGPFAVAAVIETKATSPATPALRNAVAIAASYDLGAVKLSGGYVKSPRLLDQPANDRTNFFAASNQAGGKGWFLGVVAPIGQVNIGAQMAANQETDSKALELFANYALSKRTRLYVDFVRAKDQNAVAGVAATATAGGFSAIPKDPYALGTGIVHTF